MCFVFLVFFVLDCGLCMFQSTNQSIFHRIFITKECSICTIRTLFESLVAVVWTVRFSAFPHFPCLEPFHWVPGVRTPRVLIIRGRLRIFVIHSHCRFPAHTPALIENLQMKPGEFRLLCPQLLTQWYSRLSEPVSQSREWHTGGELFKSVQQIMFLPLREMIVRSTEMYKTLSEIVRTLYSSSVLIFLGLFWFGGIVYFLLTHQWPTLPRQ